MAKGKSNKGNKGKGKNKGKEKNQSKEEENGEPRVTVTETWDDLLRENEKLGKCKKGDEPLTDDELRERMQELFPDKEESTTITRVTMARGCYNKGTNMFHSRYEDEVADGDNRPISHAYYKDDDGDWQQRTPRKGSSVGEPSDSDRKPAVKSKGKGKSSSAKSGKNKSSKGKGRRKVSKT